MGALQERLVIEVNTEEVLVVDLNQETLSQSQMRALLAQLIEMNDCVVWKDTRGINVSYRISKRD